MICDIVDQGTHEKHRWMLPVEFNVDNPYHVLLIIVAVLFHIDEAFLSNAAVNLICRSMKNLRTFILEYSTHKTSIPPHRHII